MLIAQSIINYIYISQSYYNSRTFISINLFYFKSYFLTILKIIPTKFFFGFYSNHNYTLEKQIFNIYFQN